MPSKKDEIIALAADTAKAITSSAEQYMDFLTTAANNFKYSFRDQLLIYAQKPDATACAEIGFWNSRRRWVNAGTRGIALLTDGPRGGYKLRYRAYADQLILWRGSMQAPEREDILSWTAVTAIIEGMILMDEWLAPDEVVLPSVAQQISIVSELEAESKGSALSIPQAAIDYALTSHTPFADGKLSIYQQYQNGVTGKELADFIKKSYGIGGHSDAIPGSGLWASYDGKGFSLDRDEGGAASVHVFLTWPKVEKRIRELIAADR